MLCLLLSALGCCIHLTAQDLRIQVLGTSDVHGHFRPEDTYSLRPQNQGWAKLASLIQTQRAQNPNTVLIDAGDTLQGEPVNYVRARLKPELAEPSMAVMNALGYAAMVVGNHEFDFGMGALRAAQKEARFPFLAANVVGPKDGKPLFGTATKVVVGGVTVAILGLTTPETARVMPPEDYERARFLDPVAVARTWVVQARDKEKADVVVVALHAGLGSLPGRPEDANMALRLAEEVPGIDAILTGHTHQILERVHKGVPLLQPGVKGQGLCVVDLDLRKDKGRWRVVSRAGRVVRCTDDTPADPDVLALAKPALDVADAYLNTPATQLQVDLDARMARVEDTPLAQLLHAAMRAGTGAQLTAVPINNGRVFIPKGPTSVRQFYALMPYENRAARIRVTGAQLRAYLEHAARHFHQSHEPELFNREMPGYNHDVVDGCAYAIDLTKPAGQRITGLAVEGKPVRDDQSFTLGLTTYRLYGGGGYVEAMGWKGEAELVTPELFRNLILAQVLARPTLGPEPLNRWRTIPYLDRERVYQQVR